MNHKLHIEIIVHNWSRSVYTVICHRFVTSRITCKRHVVKLTIKCLKKDNLCLVLICYIFLQRKLSKCQLLGDTTLNNFDDVYMKVRARWFWKGSFKNLLQIIAQVFHKRYMLFQILSPQLFEIRTLNMLSLTNNCINSCTGLYREGIISYPDLLLTKPKATSGQIRFCTRDCL